MHAFLCYLLGGGESRQMCKFFPPGLWEKTVCCVFFGRACHTRGCQDNRENSVISDCSNKPHHTSVQKISNKKII